MNWLTDWFAVDRWEGTSSLIAGVVAATLVLVGFAIDRAVRRSSRRSEIYAGALQAVHDYLEAPYRIRRSSGEPEERFALVAAISDIQSRLSYYEGLIALLGSDAVYRGYQELLAAARLEAGNAMTHAWLAKPKRRNAQVPLGGSLYLHPKADAAHDALVKLMRST